MLLDSMISDCLHVEAAREAERHKWNRSRACGNDVGASALDEWYRLYFKRYCLEKRLEHLQGIQPWRQFETVQYGALTRFSWKSEDCLWVHEIILLFLNGMENLTFVNWLDEQENIPHEPALELFSILDPNQARISRLPTAVHMN